MGGIIRLKPAAFDWRNQKIGNGENGKGF